MSEQTYTLAQLAATIGAEVHGDAECTINGVASITRAKPGDICFLIDSHYRSYLSNTKASAVLLPKKFIADCPTNALVMAEPRLGFAKLLELLVPQPRRQAGVHATAVIGESCRIDSSAVIRAYAVIGDNATIRVESGEHSFAVESHSNMPFEVSIISVGVSRRLREIESIEKLLGSCTSMF